MASDFSDLNRLAADLTKASIAAGPKIAAVVKKAATNVKNEARELAPKGPHLPHYASTISFDMTFDGGSIGAEIGPVKGGQGSLGNILEYGTSKHAPQAHLGPALDREGPNFEKYLGDVLGHIL